MSARQEDVIDRVADLGGGCCEGIGGEPNVVDSKTATLRRCRNVPFFVLLGATAKQARSGGANLKEGEGASTKEGVSHRPAKRS